MKALVAREREILKEMLSQCTEPQVAMFNRMYGGVETIAEDSIKRAYEQIDLTLQRNKEKLKYVNTGC